MRAGLSRGHLAALVVILSQGGWLAAAPQAGGIGELQPVSAPSPTPIAIQLEPLPGYDPPAATGTPSSTPATAGAAASPATRGPVSPAQGRPPAADAKLPLEVILLLGFAGVVLIGSTGVVLAVLLKKPVVISIPSRSSGGASPASGDFPAPEWTEGAVARVGRPPEGTLKILPGRFMIEDGDRQLELRIFRTSGDERVETTIGREPGGPYRHIQLKPFSVSGKHAKLVWDNGAYSLINYSRVNPTKVNGEELPEGASRRLVDEDRLEIGEVGITYFEV